ncbi:MAG: hypothetical protein LBF78_16045 [Treponema sp.]|jgi:hypothetical protein|nr:hypothetical protein [Treponema sp.]
MNYTALRATAKKLIGSNGARCRLRNPAGESVYNPTTNEYEQNYESHEGYCLVSAYDDHLVNDTVIKAGDRKVTAVLPAEPNPGLSRLDVFDKAGNLKENYLVVNSAPVSPNADTVILYKLQCRK